MMFRIGSTFVRIPRIVNEIVPCSILRAPRLRQVPPTPHLDLDEADREKERDEDRRVHENRNLAHRARPSTVHRAERRSAPGRMRPRGGQNSSAHKGRFEP